MYWYFPPLISPLFSIADLSSASEAEPTSDEEDAAVGIEAIVLNRHEMEHNETEVLPVKKPCLTLTGATLTRALYIPLSVLLQHVPLLPPVISSPKRVHPLCSKKSPPHSSKGHRKAKSSPVPSKGLFYATTLSAIPALHTGVVHLPSQYYTQLISALLLACALLSTLFHSSVLSWTTTPTRSLHAHIMSASMTFVATCVVLRSTLWLTLSRGLCIVPQLWSWFRPCRRPMPTLCIIFLCLSDPVSHPCL